MDSKLTALALAPAPLPPPAAPTRRRPLDPEGAAHHHGRLYRMACAMCGSPHLAEDLVQDTYLRVLSRPRVLRNDNEFFYLATALRNAMMSHFRAEGRRARPGPELDDLDPADPSGDGDPEAAAMAGEVYAAIGALAGGKRDVVAAVDVAGMTYAEAARALKLPIGTIMSRLHRARADLTEVLEAA
jgi:RNA polymerase sigma-70 factor, ECF subfamily